MPTCKHASSQTLKWQTTKGLLWLAWQLQLSAQMHHQAQPERHASDTNARTHFKRLCFELEQTEGEVHAVLMCTPWPPALS